MGAAQRYYEGREFARGLKKLRKEDEERQRMLAMISEAMSIAQANPESLSPIGRALVEKHIGRSVTWPKRPQPSEEDILTQAFGLGPEGVRELIEGGKASPGLLKLTGAGDVFKKRVFPEEETSTMAEDKQLLWQRYLTDPASLSKEELQYIGQYDEPGKGDGKPDAFEKDVARILGRFQGGQAEVKVGPRESRKFLKKKAGDIALEKKYPGLKSAEVKKGEDVNKLVKEWKKWARDAGTPGPDEWKEDPAKRQEALEEFNEFAAWMEPDTRTALRKKVGLYDMAAGLGTTEKPATKVGRKERRAAKQRKSLQSIVDTLKPLKAQADKQGMVLDKNKIKAAHPNLSEKDITWIISQL